MLLQAVLINVVVLAVVLESDLGRHRKITKFRLLRPLITSLIIIPFFIKGTATAGACLALEVLLTVAGLLIALLAMGLMQVYLSPQTGRPATRAGLGYALVWAAVMAARTVFTYGSSHWFAAPLGRWMASHHVTSNALTDALIFMALAMVLTRVAVMAIRSRAARPRAVAGRPRDRSRRRCRRKRTAQGCPPAARDRPGRPKPATRPPMPPGPWPALCWTGGPAGNAGGPATAAGATCADRDDGRCPSYGQAASASRRRRSR